jgi:hypothetical protein
MNLYEIVALCEYFYAFPTNKSYEEVLEMFINGNDEVIAWEPFERMPREAVSKLSDNLKELLEKAFIPREHGARDWHRNRGSK